LLFGNGVRRIWRGGAPPNHHVSMATRLGLQGKLGGWKERDFRLCRSVTAGAPGGGARQIPRESEARLQLALASASGRMTRALRSVPWRGLHGSDVPETLFGDYERHASDMTDVPAKWRLSFPVTPLTYRRHPRRGDPKPGCAARSALATPSVFTVDLTES